MKRIKKYQITFNPEEEMEGIELISFVHDPAVQIKGMCFSEQKEKKFEFKLNEDKMIVVAPAMIPDLEIYRRDESGEYYVIFTKEVIFDLMKKFNSQLKEFRFNLDHSSELAPAYILESWIIEDETYDKSKFYGFEGLPIGTWMISAQITDKAFWEEEIKINNKSGFSIEGWLGLQEQKLTQQISLAKIGFDFDNTLSTSKGKELAKEYLSKNDELFIITARQSDNSDAVYLTADDLGIPHSRVFFTNGADKWEKIKELGLDKFYDNNQEQINKINENTTTEGIIFKGELTPLQKYRLKKKEVKLEETYSDYPQQAVENAKIALRWVEQNGWGDCGTQVGKIRANQLANKEPISRDTIARMASFERHRQNSKKQLGDGCGRLMWLSWGGDEGIEWAQRKLKEIDNTEVKLIIEPEAGESEEEFISRCVKIEIDNGYPQDQALAMCYVKWKNE